MTPSEFKTAINDLQKNINWIWIPTDEGGESGKDAGALIERVRIHDQQLATLLMEVWHSTEAVRRYIMERGA